MLNGVSQETVDRLRDIEVANLFHRTEQYVMEQVTWWKEQGIPAYEAHEAVYGHSPMVMTWTRLANRLIRDFT